ncbi:MAG: AAA family ATPase, partial [Verrucomicrobia bacterium]|nr:AAA family ATPase [Verrucomicrobiota bacterium]
NPALLSRAANRIRPVGKDPTTSDHDITRRHWLMIDFDAIRPAGISATDEEHLAAREKAKQVYVYLRAIGFPSPIAADSGNGAHLMYRIDEPVDDDGLIHRCLDRLADQFDSDMVTIDRTVFNPARIWKLYGTLAGKGDDTFDRPHRLSKVSFTPASIEITPHEKLAELAGPKETPKQHKGGRIAAAFAIENWINDYRLDVAGPYPWKDGRKWVFNTCPWNSDHTNSSAYILQMASGAIAAGCHHNGCAGRGWSDLRSMFEPNKPQAPVKPVAAQAQSPANIPQSDTPEAADSGMLLSILEETIAGKRVNLELPWPLLTAGTKALMPGSLCIICGSGGSTKSLMVSQACLHWLSMGVPFACYHLEEDREFHLYRALAQLAGNSDLIDDDWVRRHPQETRDAYHDNFESLDRLATHIWDAPGRTATLPQLTQWVIDQAPHNRVLVIDPITAADSGDKPWQADQDFINATKTALREHGASMIVVTHPRGTGPQSDWLDNMAGGRAWSRLTPTVMRLEAVHYDSDVPVWTILAGHRIVEHRFVNRVMHILKTRSGKGSGWKIGMEFNGKTLTAHEQGVIND